jgi:hypothetical protein
VERFQTILEGTAPVRRLDKVPGAIYRTLNTVEALAPERFRLPTFNAVTCKDAFDITVSRHWAGSVFLAGDEGFRRLFAAAKDHFAVDIAQLSVPNGASPIGR